MKNKFYLLFFLFLLSMILLNCSKQEEEIGSTKADVGSKKDRKKGNDVTVGSFNIEWLGDGVRDRVDREEADYKRLADIISDIDVDVLGLQEIENEGALRRIIKYLPDYSFYVSKLGGAQNTAVLFKKDVDVQYLGEYLPLAVEQRRTRPGMLLRVKKGNFDWNMMVVHLKSTSRYDNTKDKKDESIELRTQQAQILSKWADSSLTSGKEQDIIIVGDFNDTPLKKKYKALEPLTANSNMNFLTANMKSCKYKSMYVIDQIVVSNSAKKRLVANSERIYDTFSSLTKEQAEMVSDHCPVSVCFEITSPDND